jgi:hypothetical protein
MTIEKRSSDTRVATALGLAVAGLANAAFWVLAARIGAFHGTAALDPTWSTAQLLHLFAAVLAQLAFIGVHALQRTAAGRVGDIAFAMLQIGLVLYAADAAIALFAFPAVAAAAPQLLALDGGLNTGVALIGFITFAVAGAVGGLAYAAASWRARQLPRAALAVFALGSLAMNLPPGPVPLVVLAGGGVIWAAGLVLVAVSLIRRS